MISLDDFSFDELKDFYKYLLSRIQDIKKEAGRESSQKSIAGDIDFSPQELSRLKTEIDPGKSGLIKEVISRLIDFYHLNIEEGSDKNFEVKVLKELRPLTKLAFKLSFNLVNVSTEIGKIAPHSDILIDEPKLKEMLDRDVGRERFIAIVGAGASNAISHGLMPTSKDAIQDLKERITPRIPNSILEEELDRLQQIYRLERAEFETQLLALSKFTSRKRVVKALREICGFKFIPSLAYEILAHLLKHRFIDAIINFNYDEVLDQAIEEEIHNGDYKYIVSDGHCPENYKELLIDNRLKQPVYIKPHGTISHENTLRFTNEDYFAIPIKIRETIEKLLDGKLKYPEKARAKLPLNLIVIGYNIRSYEFISLIKGYLKKNNKTKINVWVLDTYNHKNEFLAELNEKQKRQIELNFIEIEKQPFNHLDLVLEQLWRTIEKNFKNRYKPRGIERHLLVSQVFKSDKRWLKELRKDKKHKDELQIYFRDRFFVELVISFLQSDGILNAKQILEDRAGKYFNLYKKAKEKNREVVSLRKMCESVGLKVFKGFVWDTFTLKNPKVFHKIKDSKGGNLYDQMYNNICRCRLSMRHLQNISDEEDKIKRLLRGIRRRNVAKITSNFSLPHSHLFSYVEKSQILNTTLAWTYKFQKEIELVEEWDLMLSVSEKGRFLRVINDAIDLKNKKFGLVLSSFDDPNLPNISPQNEEKLRSLSLIDDRLLFLPWWLHNRHLVLLLKRKHDADEMKTARDKFDLVSGFYYESRMLSRRVNPVYIKHQEDLEILLNIFANYWHRANVYTQSLSDIDHENIVPIIQNKGKIDDYINELLDKWESSPLKPN